MTAEVTVQSAPVAIFPEDLNVTEQSTFVAIFVGTRVSITEQTAFIAMFSTGAAKKRRVATIISG